MSRFAIFLLYNLIVYSSFPQGFYDPMSIGSSTSHACLWPLSGLLKGVDITEWQLRLCEPVVKYWIPLESVYSKCYVCVSL